MGNFVSNYLDLALQVIIINGGNRHLFIYKCMVDCLYKSYPSWYTL